MSSREREFTADISISCEEFIDAFVFVVDNLLLTALDNPISPWKTKVPFSFRSPLLFSIDRDEEMTLSICPVFPTSSPSARQRRVKKVEVRITSDFYSSADDSFFEVLLHDAEGGITAASQSHLAELAFMVVLWDKMRKRGFNFVERARREMKRRRKILEKAEEPMKRLAVLLQVLLL
ncbi:MAG: hypothetical protein QXJ59_04450 [Thermofilaceae archaeon]